MPVIGNCPPRVTITISTTPTHTNIAQTIVVTALVSSSTLVIMITSYFYCYDQRILIRWFGVFLSCFVSISRICRGFPREAMTFCSVGKHCPHPTLVRMRVCSA